MLSRQERGVDVEFKKIAKYEWGAKVGIFIEDL